MKHRVLAGLALALVTTSCSATDREFEAWCNQREANGWQEAKADEKTCALKDYLTEEEKEQVMQTPSELRKQGVHVGAASKDRQNNDH